MITKNKTVSKKFAQDLLKAVNPTSQYGQPAKINGKPITAKVANLGTKPVTPAPKSGFKGAGDALSSAAQKKVFKSANLKNVVHPATARQERKAQARLDKEEKAAKKKLERELNAKEKAEAKAKRVAEKSSKRATEREVKGEFISKGDKLVFDGVVVEAQQTKALVATKKYIEAKGWDILAQLIEGKLILTPKMEQGNISRQRCLLSGFVAGYVQALND